MKPPWSLGAGDFFWGNVIELSPDAGGRVEQAWSGLDQATVYGFQGLNVSDGTVRSAGVRPVSLDYQFWSLLPIENCRLELAPSGGKAFPSVEMSRCGAPGEWRELNEGESGSVFAVEQFKGRLREFRIRLTFDGAEAAFAGARLVGDAVVPEDKAVSLYPKYYHGWRRHIQYQQRLEVGLRQRNGSGIRAHISSRLKTLEVTASVERADIIAEQ